MESTFQLTRRQWTILICLWVSISTVVYSDDTEEIKTWCEAFASGRSARVTCHFSENLNMSRHDFSLLHDSPVKSSFPAMACNWQPTFECNPAKGYTFNKKVSDQVEVEIPHATSQDHDGNYTCSVVGKSGKGFEACRLNIAGVPGPPTKLHVQNETLESVKVCWKRLPDKGQQVSYRVQYRPRISGAEYITRNFCCPSDNCVLIAGLKPGTGYEISVLAFNEFGESSYTDLEDIAKTRSIINQPETSHTPAIVVGVVVVAVVTAIIAGVVVECKYKCIVNRCRREQTNRKEPIQPDPHSGDNNPTTKDNTISQDPDLPYDIEKGKDEENDPSNAQEEEGSLIGRQEPEGKPAGEIQDSPKSARKWLKNDAEEAPLTARTDIKAE